MTGAVRLKEIDSPKNGSHIVFLHGGAPKLAQIGKTIGQSTSLTAPFGTMTKNTIELKPYIRDICIESDGQIYRIDPNSLTRAIELIDVEIEFDLFQNNQGTIAKIKGMRQSDKTYGLEQILDFCERFAVITGVEAPRGFIAKSFKHWEMGKL